MTFKNNNGASMLKNIILVLAFLILTATANLSIAGHHEVKEAIEAQNAKLSEALAAGDAALVASLYSPDAVVMPPGSTIIVGRGAIQKLFQGLIDSGINSASLVAEDVESSGNLAREIGKGVFGMKDGSFQPPVKYVVVWKLNDEGVWQLHADIWNSLP
jgi:uncharacterized protein (TIGR02246 family)